MKKMLLVVLIITCVFGTATVYAGRGKGVAYGVSRAVRNGWFTKKCPDCRGHKGESTWYGGWEPCSTCNGKGKVIRWWAVLLAIVVGVGIFVEWVNDGGSKTNKEKR